MHPVCVFFGHMLSCVVTHECSLCLWSVVSLTSLFCLISMLMTVEPRKVARVAGIHSAALIKKASEQGRERTTEAEGGREREGDSQEVGGVVRRRRRRKERMWKWKRQAWPRRNSVRISRKGKNEMELECLQMSVYSASVTDQQEQSMSDIMEMWIQYKQRRKTTKSLDSSSMKTFASNSTWSTFLSGSK